MSTARRAVEQIAGEIDAYLSDHDLLHERVSSTEWAVQLRGEKKLSTTVLIALRERVLRKGRRSAPMSVSRRMS